MTSTLPCRLRSHLKLAMILAILALVVTSYLVLKHYQPVLGQVCHFNSYFDCDTVNKSVYSRLFGIPVSILGLFSYMLIFGLSLMMYRRFNFKKFGISSYQVLTFLLGFTLFGALFSLYLTYAELFILRAVCIFCVMQQILIIMLLVTFAIIFSHVGYKRKRLAECGLCYEYFGISE